MEMLNGGPGDGLRLYDARAPWRRFSRPKTDHGGHDGAGRALRYLEWTYDPDPDDTTFFTDFALLLREGASDVRVRYDRHVEGLFARATWLDLLREVGFVPSVVVDHWQRDVFVGFHPPPA